MTEQSPSRLLVLPLLLGLAACGDGTFATEGGESILVPSATAFSFQSAGGGLPTPTPAGALCSGQVWSYGVQLGSGVLSWSRCDVAGTGSEATDYTPATGSRTLTAAELQAVKTSVAAVHVSTRDTCGADKPSLSITVTAGASSLVYGDDFYACVPTNYQHFVDGTALDSLEGVLIPLATP